MFRISLEGSGKMHEIKPSVDLCKARETDGLCLFCYWLVVWNMTFMTFHILGMSSSQLTFGTFFIFPYIGNFIIPTDELIFFRGVGIPPTRLCFISCHSRLIRIVSWGTPNCKAQGIPGIGVSKHSWTHWSVAFSLVFVTIHLWISLDIQWLVHKWPSKK